MDSKAQSVASNSAAPNSTARNSATRFQREFDRLLLGLIGLGLAGSLVFGATARTCPAPSQSAVAGSAQPSNGPIAVRASAVTPVSAVPAPQSAGQRPSVERSECGEGSWFGGSLLALFIALGALAVGTFAGFLFGLPRSLTSSEFREARQQAAISNPTIAAGAVNVNVDSNTGSPTNAPSPGSPSDVNTNLEKISDWLTTIIVGVGLTKLQDIPSSIDDFGNHVAPFFGYGGKVFGIGGGLFFLIAGFFLAYVGTRVKLSLVFILSQWTNRVVAQGVVTADVIRLSTDASIVSSNATTMSESVAATPGLQEADELLLSKALSELKTPAEIIAWANAKARNGDYSSALTAYKDVWGRVPFTEKMQTDYAAILAATGDTAGANSVVATLATAGLTPDAEREARQKVAAATQTGQTAILRTRLQQGLYRPAERGYEDSILAGEELFRRPEQDSDAMAHVWLACAYGQKHAVLKAAATVPPPAPFQQQLDELADLAVAQVKRALEIERGLQPLVRSLYVPGMELGDDIDLQSLNPNTQLDTLLGADPSSA